MLSRLWGWIAAAFAMLGAALIYVGGQRNRAREAADIAKAQVKGQQRARETERNIVSARREAQESSRETRREHESRDSNVAPIGSFRRK